SESKVRNLTDRPVEVQIRVGSILRKAYRLGPGCTKTLYPSRIKHKYSPRGETAVLYEGRCEPYVWIHSSTANLATAKKQFLSLHDLKTCGEMKICKDSGNGAFT
ncbi:hypothetical protein KI387_025547, partial [Taxus chinensis]